MDNKNRYRRWTQGAIECYQRGCVCAGCLTGQIIEQHCRMKITVMELVKRLGAPPKSLNLIPGATEHEENIIAAILEGASTLKQIAESLELNEKTINQRLGSLYRLVEDDGYQFKSPKTRNRLPEFIEYVKKLQAPNDTTDDNIILDEEIEKKGNSIMYDKDLNLEYANGIAPIIEAIKKGFERPVHIEKQTGIPQISISAALNQFAHRLENLGLINLNKEISTRQTVINFIQSRLLDPEYKEEINTPPLPVKDIAEDKPVTNSEVDLTEKLTEKEAEVVNLLLEGLDYQQIAKKLIISLTTVKTHINNIFSKRNYHSLQELLITEMRSNTKNETVPDYAALMDENEELRKRIAELEEQAQPVIKCDLSSVKAKINQDIMLLTQKLKLVEELEKEVM